MITGLIMTHCRLGHELLKAAEGIAGKQENVIALSNNGLSLEGLKEAVAQFLKERDVSDGLLIFVDMLGGSPWRVAKELIYSRDAVSGPVGLLTGVHLAMLLSFCQKRKTYAFEELTSVLQNDGKRGIHLDLGAA